jgi:hypothetical protein
MTLTAGTALTDLDGSQVAQLQSILMQAGYNPGPIDGILGPQTRNAYQAFLARNASDQDANSVGQLVANLSTNETPELWTGVISGGGNSTNGTAQTIPNSVPNPPSTYSPQSGTSPTTMSGLNDQIDPGTEESVRARYPHLAYLLNDPEVKSVLLTATQKGMSLAELQGLLYQTNWWRTTSAAIRTWDQKAAQDPAQAQAELEQRKIVVENQFRTLGLSVTKDDVQWWANRILREGWTQEQFNKALGEIARNNWAPLSAGSLQNKAASLKAMAKSYLSDMTDQQALDYATRIFDGSMTEDGINSLLRNEAKGRFSWLSSEIDSGMSPTDLFSGVKSNVARMLEVDPNTIDLTSPKWSALTSPVFDQGIKRSINLNEAQAWARSQTEWRFTRNANDEAEQMGMGILKAMGVFK